MYTNIPWHWTLSTTTSYLWSSILLFFVMLLWGWYLSIFPAGIDISTITVTRLELLKWRKSRICLTFSLQTNVNIILEWCQNSKSLNVNKWSVASYTRCDIGVTLDNNTQSETVPRSDDSLQDLCVLFNSKLIFAQDISYVRTCRNSFNALNVVRLYGSLVRSRLEYAGLV